ncbi:hypothetical protein P152DRAFT_311380 [Eremomyces bilateralis CBS 781.70]|uniref:Mg2+ transporter protein n=1 Tax=Eremomyces bilateralis CBS 781.70 TaxID=1392243 RepID=A0A6G1G5A7_9PEZI|nr:uncharacterized protein P152DRAFT_311380 [Eremomyces bilateralis CBS 781.70]KAF1813257.1 hypothetical protein P152DRAFT_311380 [Eremomyces bilateralis CBS 781.70]
MLAPFNVPDFLSNQLCTDLNGYLGSKSALDDNGKLVDLRIWFQCLVKKVLKPEEERVPDGNPYLWYEMTCFTYWYHPHRCRVLCIGTPDTLRERLQAVLNKPRPLNLGDPLAMLDPLLNEIIQLYDESTWRARDAVRAIEENRLKRRPDFMTMHEISRHTSHVVETESVAIEAIESLLQRQEALHQTLPTELGNGYLVQARERLSFQLQMMKSLKWRSLSTQERLNAEVNVAYNMIASQDSVVIKSIAFLTMAFLPATFVSTVFSTTFFSFGEDKWKTSNQFWIYWAVVIPSTLLVLLSWWLWLENWTRISNFSGIACGKRRNLSSRPV